MRSRFRTWRATVVLACLACTVLLPEFETPASGQFFWVPEPTKRVANVLVLSKMLRTPLINALSMDTESINLTVITSETLAPMSVESFNQSLARADVIYVDRFLPGNHVYLQLIASHVNGTFSYDGLIMFGIMQNGTIPGEGDFTSSQVNEIAAILPVNLNTSYVNSTGNTNAPGYVIQVELAAGVLENSTILADCIPWNACPLVDRRLLVTTKPAATIVLNDQNKTEPVLSEWNISNNDSRVMCFSMVITEHNLLFTSSPYFSYLMYVCTFHALYNFSDALIDSWEEWRFSPGYNGDIPWAWILVTIGLAGVASWYYLKTRKKDGKGSGDGKEAERMLEDNTEQPGSKSTESVEVPDKKEKR